MVLPPYPVHNTTRILSINFGVFSSIVDCISTNNRPASALFITLLSFFWLLEEKQEAAGMDLLEIYGLG